MLFTASVREAHRDVNATAMRHERVQITEKQ